MISTKRAAALTISALLLAGCAQPSSETQEPAANESSAAENQESGSSAEETTAGTLLKAPEDDVELYKAVRAMGPYLAAFDEETIDALQNYFIMNFELNPTINDNLALFADPDDETKAKIEELRSIYNKTIQVKDYDKATFDIWEGHDELPVPGTEIDPSDTTQACLADDPGYRPVINDWRLEDPSKAIGTLIAVPSVRASATEELELAMIFNKLGYNVFGVEYRFNQVEEAAGYSMLALDTQRAVRYIKYHAKDLGINADQISVIAGSKGNSVHLMTTQWFDADPVEYCEENGLKLEGYECDEIDEVPANTAVSIFSYGNMGVVDRETGEFALDDRGLCSKENFDKGYKLPAMMFLSGTQDFAGFTLPGIIDQLYKWNNDENSLYPINWEIHIFDGVPHGFGAGTAYPNVTEGWNEVSTFIQQVTGQN